MSDEPEPPAAGAVATDLRVAHLTKAVTRKGEIRFEVGVPESDSAPELAEALRTGFFIDGMKPSPGYGVPISVDEHGASRITVVYKPPGKRNRNADMRVTVAVFEEMGIPITDAIRTRIQQAFEALKQFDPPEPAGAVGAELARRQTRKGPGGGRGPLH